jgi:hypothetical protein
LTLLPTLSLPVVTTPWWPNTAAWIFCVSSTAKMPCVRAQFAAVADLAAGFGIERRVVEHHHAHLAFVQFIDRRAVLVQREHVALGLSDVVAVEGGRRAVVVEVGSHLELAGGARLFLLARHRGIEAGGVDRHLALAADVGREVEREAVGVVQLERGLAVERGALTGSSRRAPIRGSPCRCSMVAKKRSSSCRSTSITRRSPLASSG